MGLPCLSGANMSSASYRIPTSVVSGGGAPMGSVNFKTNATIGQSAPLAFTSSTNFRLYPGFWYTLSHTYCRWDSNSDGDVDGLDLYQFIDPYDDLELESFTEQFGRTDCSD
jgi:hypothetical protein